MQSFKEYMNEEVSFNDRLVAKLLAHYGRFYTMDFSNKKFRSWNHPEIEREKLQKLVSQTIPNGTWEQDAAYSNTNQTRFVYKDSQGIPVAFVQWESNKGYTFGVE